MDEEMVIRPLTARQRDVLREIVRYFRAIGEAPSQRFVARRLGISQQRVLEHLNALHDKGWLTSPSTSGLRCAHTP